MRLRRGAALVAAVGACAALFAGGGAGAATHPGIAKAAQFDLSTRSGVVSYLASHGLQPQGFVIQRGQRNYAGPNCPGKGWTCTTSTRVVQIATRPGAVNRYEYSTAAAAVSPCGTVQNGPTNNAKASITGASPQSCTIVQHATGSGSNSAQLTETIQQTEGASQTASQDAQVTQTSVTGSNSVQITQKVTQSISDSSATSVNESQVSDQTYSVNQNVTQSTATVGRNSSKVDQSLTQTESAPSAETGSQYQRANLIGHVDQFSHALSTSQNNQTENQTQTAVQNSAVLQTQVGPTRCCTSQGDNAADTFKVVQKATQSQNTLPANRSTTEDAQIDLSTTGSANGQQTITQNGVTTTNSSTGSTVNIGTTCTQGTCTPTSGGFPSGDVFVSFSDGKVREYQPNGTLVRTLETGSPYFVTGGAFDLTGNFYVTEFGSGAVAKFAPSGAFVGTFGSGFSGNNPESILFDTSGNAYVGQAEGTKQVLKFDAGGNLLATFAPTPEDRGTDWIELAPDQCTLYYTSEGTSVKRFNVCTNVQGLDFATALPGGPAFALRLLPDGTLLVADSNVIVRLNTLGVVQTTYDTEAGGFWFGLSLDPNGTSFWAANPGTSDVVKFNIATGAVEASFNTGTGVNTLGGVTVAP
jgi:hypothetical protein